MRTVPSSALTTPISGLNLSGPILADQLPPARPSLLVFLRHFG